MNSNDVPNFIPNEKFRAGLEAMGIPLSINKITLRSLEEFERAEFLVDKSTKSFWVAEVEWVECGSSARWATCSKRVLIPLSPSQEVTA